MNLSNSVVFDQGLVNAISHVLPSATEAFCTQHIKANIEKEFGREAGRLFGDCVRESSRQGYGKALKAFSKLPDGQKIRAYIRKIPTTLWASHAFKQRRWGYTTSNIVEIINGVLSTSGARQLPPLKLLHHIWEYQQHLFAERQIEARKGGGLLCASATAYLNKTLQAARSWDIIPARADDDEMKATIRSQNRLSHGRLEEHIAQVFPLERGMACTCGRCNDDARPCEVSLLAFHLSFPQQS